MNKQRNNKEKRESAREKVGNTAMERRMLERSVYEACVSSPEGADLLVNSFVQALMSYRRASVCKPFPNSLFSECCSNEKDFASAMEAVQHIPHIHKIALSKQPDQELEDWTLDRSSYHATALQEMPFMSLKLLQWLLFSREHMELTSDPAKELSRLLTMRFSPWTTSASKLGMGKALLPEFVLRVKEAKKDDQLDNFAEIRSRSGSFFAFHGTAAENLYSILRCGLLNMSRTQMQRNGAIFGEGIYFSMDPNVAVGFSTAGRGWNFSCFGERQKYVLLCEIANGEGVLCSDGSKPICQKATTSRDEVQSCQQDCLAQSSTTIPKTYVIVQNINLVKIRYIFVYCDVSDSINTRTDISLHPQSTSIQYSQRHGWMPFLRLNVFKIAICFYILLLLGIGFMNSGRTKHRKKPIFLLFWS